MSQGNLIFNALRDFAEKVTEKMSQLTQGEPEEQLITPFENLMGDFARALNWEIVCVGESHLSENMGIPDFALNRNQILAGYAELKAPGKGALASRFTGHDREQFNRFKVIPNILYTDGNEWALYRNGELVGSVVRLTGDVAVDGQNAVTLEDTVKVESLLHDFLLWEPILPFDRKGKIDLKGFATMLAPLCRMLREDVKDALKNPDSPLIQLAKDWRQLLFPQAEDEQFADAYAQTVTFALLLGRTEGADPLTFQNAENVLRNEHSLLSRALLVLTDSGENQEIAASIKLLLRVISAVPTNAFQELEDPWLNFYEDFLAVYDPQLRRKAGAYYTPVEVVRCQVRLIDDLLVNRFGKQMGFADSEVITLDPAVGTGTYLLGVIEHALDRIKTEQGEGAVAGQATSLAENLYGFELMTGPYAVSELRVSRALRDRGAELPTAGAHIYLTDTLESPHTKPPVPPAFLQAIAEQHKKALHVKSNIPVIVCLGNPPYGRHEAITEENRAHTGGWVRWGDDGEGRQIIPVSEGASRNLPAILHEFIDPAAEAGYGLHVKNLYNLYVYFWRWALWKVFEHQTSKGSGIVSFITASSFLDGVAFCGMREHMRRLCDQIWILDLGGEGRGTRQDENIFDIQTPVAIAVAVRSKKTNPESPAVIYYTSIEGTREEKLRTLDKVENFAELNWEDCPQEWHAAFRPAGTGDFFDWPLLTDLMPWQHSGIQLKRTWPICHDPGTLGVRWQKLLNSEKMRELFKETRDRKIDKRCDSLEGTSQIPLSELSKNTSPPKIERYSYRSFDRQWIFADTR